ARRPAGRPGARVEHVRPVATRREAPALALGKVVREGIQVECRVIPLTGGGSPSATPREGQDVRFEFAITDTASDAPISKSYPSAWMVERPEGAPLTTAK